MDISGPLKIGVVEPSAQGNYELHIDFDEAFKAADLATQGEQFRAYLVPLGDKVRMSAAKAWNDGDRESAVRVLVEGAIAEPENRDIPTMLAKLLMRLGRYTEAHQVLGGLLAIFDSLGGDHPLVKKYRGELARLIH